MKRDDLITEIAKRTGMSKRVVKIFVDAYQDAIIDAVRNGEDVSLHGFLKIERKIKKGRKVYDFHNSCPMIVGDREVISIRPSSVLEGCV